MEAARGTSSFGVAAQLQNRPERFSFHQAVRLARLLVRGPVGGAGESAVGEEPWAGQIGFTTSGSLDYPLSDIASIAFADDGVDIVTDILTLAGNTGLLPGYWSDGLAPGEDDDEAGLHGFLDLFHQRLLELLYDVWEKTAFAVREERGDEEGIGRCLLTLIGLGTPGLDTAFGTTPAETATDSLRYVAAILNGAPRTAQGFADILSELLGVPATVEPLWGRWRRIPERLRWRLGSREGSGLGEGAILGHAVYSRTGTVTVRIGPVGPRLLNLLLEQGDDGTLPPLQSALKQLADYVLSGAVVIRVEVEISPELRPDLRLGRVGSGITPRLGSSAWLGAGRPDGSIRTVIWL